MKLGDLRRFVVEACAADMADGKADRLAVLWINEALADLHAAHRWRWYQGAGQVVLSPVVSGVAASITANSTRITLGGTETFLQAWLDDRWALHFDGASPVLYRLASIDAGNQQAGYLDAAYVGATDAAGDYDVVPTRYVLPDDAQGITEALLASTRTPIHFLEPGEFDRYRYDTASQRGDPIYFTVRSGYVEPWPAPTAGLRALTFSYTKKPPSYTTTTKDDVEVDWKPEWDTLLRRAVRLQVAAGLGQNSPIAYDVAKLDYEQMLRSLRIEDARYAPALRGMGLGGVPPRSLPALYGRLLRGPVT